MRPAKAKVFGRTLKEKWKELESRRLKSLCELESDGRIVIFITSQNKKKKNVGLQLKIGWWSQPGRQQGHMNCVSGSSITLAHAENNQNWREIVPSVQFKEQILIQQALCPRLSTEEIIKRRKTPSLSSRNLLYERNKAISQH